MANRLKRRDAKPPTYVSVYLEYGSGVAENGL